MKSCVSWQAPGSPPSKLLEEIFPTCSRLRQGTQNSERSCWENHILYTDKFFLNFCSDTGLYYFCCLNQFRIHTLKSKFDIIIVNWRPAFQCCGSGMIRPDLDPTFRSFRMRIDFISRTGIRIQLACLQIFKEISVPKRSHTIAEPDPEPIVPDPDLTWSKRFGSSRIRIHNTAFFIFHSLLFTCLKKKNFSLSHNIDRIQI